MNIMTITKSILIILLFSISSLEVLACETNEIKIINTIICSSVNHSGYCHINHDKVSPETFARRMGYNKIHYVHGFMNEGKIFYNIGVSEYIK